MGKKFIEYDKIVVDMKGIVKKFGDFVANDHIDLTVHKGEVHALLGENGAGKSTLMNVLYGFYDATEGQIFVNGEKITNHSPTNSISKGIGMVHQHFMLVQNFTVAENIVLGKETVKGKGLLDRKKAVDEVRELSERYGLLVEPEAKIQDISVGMQQRVEILKTLYRGAEILILDEPTAVLIPQEIEELIEIIHNLVKEGKTIIIITHKLNEVKSACDYCTIIRRGKKIDTVDVDDVTQQDLAEKMVGRAVEFKIDKKEHATGNTILKVEDLHVRDNRNIQKVSGLNLEVKEGEILGVAGVDGNGQSEFLEAINGLREVESGKITAGGVDITYAKPKVVTESGVAIIPEDRQKRGLVLDFNLAENFILQKFKKAPFASERGILVDKEIYKYGEDLISEFDIRPPKVKQLAGELSGGNQQKVVIAREISNLHDLLIAVQPTRGLDVGAIEYVHKALIEERNKGRGVLLVSFELDEIMGLSDRIAVMYEGEIVKIFQAGEVTENEIGLLMAGGVRHE
jgi:simple sugar transport system ATP-binding protein